ncbi:MAG: YqaE/Pmp3 family membrane protein [Cyanobacteria bacterium P01_D01_bin.50]
MDVFRIFIALLFPPLAVFLQVGFGKHFWFNIAFTIAFWIPGIIHAFWVISKFGD